VVDTACHRIARGCATPVVVLHERRHWHAPGAPSPAHASVMRKWGALGWKKVVGWVHELHIDRVPGPVGHGHAIAARPKGWSLRENLSQSSGRQDRMPCHAALDLLGGLIQHICTERRIMSGDSTSGALA
jgi:hypothetical protein